MQTVITIGIVLAAAGYLAWLWAPKRQGAATNASEDASGTCTGCSGCSGR
ncbi:MAG: hypothetical protein IPM12_15375 [Flavobacteriales bacterium]|nr:hypothetical protein [Flavobacteriales bacterium]